MPSLKAVVDILIGIASLPHKNDGWAAHIFEAATDSDYDVQKIADFSE